MDSQYPDISGQWTGVLSVNGTDIEIRMGVTVEEDGMVVALTIPDQGVIDLPSDSAGFYQGEWIVEYPLLKSEYHALLNDGVLDGEWRQAGMSFDLDLEKKESTSAENLRPQNPEGPFPYREERVIIYNEADQINLGATVTLPEGEGPFPAVVLVTGSGQQNRDEEILGHKPFAVLADYLTRRGIAVIRYDDRGVGESEGDPSLDTSADFARDAAAVYNWIIGREDVDAERTGILGHSEGAVIIALLQEAGTRPAFAVYLGGQGVSGTELLMAQTESILRAQGATEEQIRPVLAMNQEIYTLVSDNPGDFTFIESQIREILQSAGLSGDALEGQVNALASPWFKFFLGYSPKELHRSTSVPTLALLGEKDVQVPSAINAPVLEEDLSQGHSANRVVVFPEMNHLFQHAETGSIQEYGMIRETLAPEVLETIGDWIDAL